MTATRDKDHQHRRGWAIMNAPRGTDGGWIQWMRRQCRPHTQTSSRNEYATLMARKGSVGFCMFDENMCLEREYNAWCSLEENCFKIGGKLSSMLHMVVR